MASQQLTPDKIAELSSLVANYITAQREKALPLAVPLSPAQRAAMDGFFLPQVLDTRLLVLTESRVENPPFYVPLRRMGFTNLPSFSTMAAVTLCDVVVSHQLFSDATIIARPRVFPSILSGQQIFHNGILAPAASSILCSRAYKRLSCGYQRTAMRGLRFREESYTNPSVLT